MVGDEVYARPRDGRIGTFAERIAVDEDDLAIKPTNLSMAEAASVPLVATPRLLVWASRRSGQGQSSSQPLESRFATSVIR